MNAPTGRASTPAEKRAVIERIHAAWMLKPGMPIGGMIARAIAMDGRVYADDTTLVELCEAVMKEHPR